MSGTDDVCDVLVVGDALTSPELRDAVPVMVMDPVVYLERDGEKTVFAPQLDVPLLEALDDVEVVSFDELTSPGDAPATLDWDGRIAELTVRACRTRGVRRVRTPTRFPLLVAQALAAAGIEAVADEGLFVRRRRVKTAAEVAGMRRALAALRSGWDAVRTALREVDGVTSEELRMSVLRAVAAHDVIPFDIVILPHGPDSAVGHASGSGVVRDGEPLIADLVVRDRVTGMHADSCRTFCKGEIPAELKEYRDLCEEALHAVMAIVAPGVSVDELNRVASETFERAGQPTLRKAASRSAMDRGFSHSLGHGVGLRVHEPPLVGAGGAVELLENEVLAIEPGLYRVGFGGCRLEDMVLVTSGGAEVLTDYPYALEP